MHIKLVADPFLSNSDRKNPQWIVNITADEKLVKQKLNLHNPLNSEEQKDCKWYLEKYLGVEPYSTTRAKVAVTALDKYGQSLVDQLQLSDLLSGTEHSLTIDVQDVSVSNSGHDSVHQLSWEFLEDDRLWGVPALRVCVRRLSCILEHPILRHERMSSWTRDPSSRTRINVLLVTARDLGTNSTTDSDASPTIVSDILADVRARLKSAQAPVDLNLEVVRPGTWEALKVYLERSSRVHGRNYFHVIHFDVHGQVIKKNGSNIGILYFGDPKLGSTTTKKVLACKVAKEVGKQGIPIAILNACESAKANAGEAANIAHSFAQAGINNVLAMTYQVSESTTTAFLGRFYMEFLVRGRNFTDSAMFARQTLRIQPMRRTRFQQQSPLSDWFIPVVYTSSPNLSLLCAESVQDSLLDEKLAEVKDSLRTIEERAPYGREFDLLRLEKNLIAGEVLYLFGPPGIGKTTFLRYVASSWRSTSFVDAVVFLDFALLSITSMEDFYTEIARQLHFCKNANDLRDGILHSKENDSERLLEILADIKVAFILDGLVDYRPTKFHSKEDELIIKFLVPSVFRFLEKAMSQPGEIRDENHITIVSGRTKELGRLIRHDERSLYELKGLRLIESVAIINERGIPSAMNQSLGRTDHLAQMQQMQLLAHLLQGNPAALAQVSRIGQELGIHPRQMYDILHSENPLHYLDPSLLSYHLELLEEFKSLLFSLTKEVTAALLMLSWYWHEGPDISVFAEMLVTMQISSRESTIRAALREASHWGFIQLHPTENRVSWIHPLFTIFCRVIACSSYSGFMFQKGGNGQDFRSNFAAHKMGHLVANAQGYLAWPAQPLRGLEYAIRLVYTVLSSHSARDNHQHFWMYVIHFLRAHQSSNDRLSSLIISTSLDKDIVSEAHDHCKQNFIFCLKLCRGRGPLPLPPIGWPTEAMTSQGHFLRGKYNTEESIIVARYYEELLNGAVTHSKMVAGKDAVRPQDLAGILELASVLIELHRRDIPLTESRHMEIIDFVDRIADESDKAFGSSSNKQVAASNALFSIAKATALLEDQKIDESKLEIQKMVAGLRDILDTSNPANAAQFDKFLEGKDPQQVKIWRDFMYSSKSSVGGIEGMWEMVVQSVRGEKIMDDSNPDTASPFPFKLPYTIPKLAVGLELPEVRLDHLEEDLNRGHWLRAMGHHSGFVVRAVADLDFDQALEHIQAQDHIAMQYEPGYATQNGQFQQKTADAREAVKMFQKFVESSTARDNLNLEDLSKSQEHMYEFLHSKGLLSPELQQMRDILQENSVRDMDSSLPHNSAPTILSMGSDPRLWMKSLFGKHLLKSHRDTRYQQMTIQSIVNVLTTLRDLENAEDGDDEKAIFTYLAEMDQLAADSVCGDLIQKHKIEERRVWNTSRLFSEAWRQTSLLTKEKRFEEARVLAIKCDSIVALGQLTPELRAGVAMTDSVESFVVVTHFWHLFELAQQALASGDHKGASKYFQNALQLNENDRVVNSKMSASTVNLVDCVSLVRMELNWTNLKIAVNDQQWCDGVNLCKEWRSQEIVWQKAMESEVAGVILDMEKTCSKLFAIQTFSPGLFEAATRIASC